MNILELSIQLRELSDDYSRQRMTLDEYRLKRKQLLDEIDQTLNNQGYADTSRNVEETEESHGAGNIMPEDINRIFEADKQNDDAG